MSEKILLETQTWFKSIVLDLNLCPFAHKPQREGTIRWRISRGGNEREILAELIQETNVLEQNPASKYETSLLIIPQLLGDFYDYQFFLEEANYQLKRRDLEGIFQLASFHPNYCFAGTQPEDPSNLTNRSPYPIIHILREESLSNVLEHVDSPENIPEKNIDTMRKLEEKKKRQLFSYLKL